MKLMVYMHRTKKNNLDVCGKFEVGVEPDELMEKFNNDLEYINTAFRNDILKIMKTTEPAKKYGTAYISFLRPQYEGPEEENGNDMIYFDNTDMIFKKKE